MGGGGAERELVGTAGRKGGLGWGWGREVKRCSWSVLCVAVCCLQHPGW